VAGKKENNNPGVKTMSSRGRKKIQRRGIRVWVQGGERKKKIPRAQKERRKKIIHSPRSALSWGERKKKKKRAAAQKKARVVR
jgi:hypothetical protein